ncbi:sugar kinase [Salinimonas sp. HHU 13199]|uniref:Sugar kinase n=1 Tax=Salinimonas profundi TaxID=2729140 RepID=A0ABR8LR60_9ALTE|nr:sugar kinase [Salinimonas profundi]MBD3586419.1 sugar kinase [Salinimonas profundi]
MNHIVIFGECMIELVTQSAHQLAKSFAGDTFNTAVYLKRCAPVLEVHYLTAIGSDEQSDELYHFMQQEKLGVDLVHRSASRHLGLYMVHTDNTGERSFTYWRSESAATQTLHSVDGELPDTDLFYLSGISVAILDDTQRHMLVDKLTALRQRGCKIVFDLNYRPALWKSPDHARQWADRFYAMADIALSGVDDHAQLYAHQSVSEIVTHLSRFSIDEQVIKHGAYGVVVNTQSDSWSVPVEPVETVIDTTAAGDAFNAGYLAARGKGADPVSAAKYAAKVAAFVIGYPGAITPPEKALPRL